LTQKRPKGGIEPLWR